MNSIKSVLFALVLSLASFAALAAGPVNVNTADAPAIAEAMKGVGLKKAEAIVAYRKEHGAFKSLDQLAEVKGIGLKTVEANRAALTLGGSASK